MAHPLKKASALPFTAVIMAGGFGTRLQSVLRDLPKPMAPVAGKPFLEWLLRYVQRQGIGSVLLSTGYLARTVSDYFESNPLPNLDCRCVLETDPLGTAGGFLNAVSAADQKAAPSGWLVLNGDSLALADLAQLASLLEKPQVDGVVLSVWMEDAARYGSLQVAPDGRLQSFLEKKAGPSWINAGIYLIRPSLLERFPGKLPLSWENDVFPELLGQGAFFAVARQAVPFIDIGLPESLGIATDFVYRNLDSFST